MEIDRRDFLKMTLLGSAAVLAAGCDTDPVEKMYPHLIPPYDYVPGRTILFATTCEECPASCGLLVRTREGRAIKIEGNPLNPMNRGRICLQAQSTLQALYSPSRIKGPLARTSEKEETIDWSRGGGILLEKLKAREGEVLYIGPPRSGAFPTLVREFLQALGGGKYLALDMSPLHSLKKANKLVFGKEEIPYYALERAKLLISFGADFLETWLNPVELTRKYAKMHSYSQNGKGKHIHIGPHMSLTGTNADQWIPCPSGCEHLLALGICKLIMGSATHLSQDERALIDKLLEPYRVEQIEKICGIPATTIGDLAHEIMYGAPSLVMAGGNSGASLHATQLQVAVNLLNYLAGNIGKTILFGADYLPGIDDLGQMETAITEMRDGRYKVVLIENVNPAFVLPKDSGFVEVLKGAAFSVSLSTELDETARLCDLHLPTNHFLESWGDARSRRGVYALQQPVMAKVPGFDTKGVGDLILWLAKRLRLSGFEESNYREYLKGRWKELHKELELSVNFEQFWKNAVQRGGYYQDFEPVQVSLDPDLAEFRFSYPPEKRQGLTLLAVNSNLHNANAKGGNRSWLAEVPHPVTQVVWDSWVEIHPNTARRLGIRHGDLVEVSSSSGKVNVAAWLYYGIHESAVAMCTGMGREVMFPNYSSPVTGGKFFPVIENQENLKIVPVKVGVNVMELLSWRLEPLCCDLAFAGEEVEIRPTGKKAYLVTMDGQYLPDVRTSERKDPLGFGDRSQKGRGLIQVLNLDREGRLHEPKQERPHHLAHSYILEHPKKKGFYRSIPENVDRAARLSGKNVAKYHDPYKWEMIIDLDRCIGCSACVVACYAENNIPVVGKDRAGLGREMSWMRVERYIEKNPKTGRFEIYYVPQMCQQCDNAGCEPVCPVYATYQTPDGLNAMIYNRCVGTRYCSNNCPYKVRRFNWRTYMFPAPLHLQLNPAVSVRCKGVMEKCTFCQHRIREAKDRAKDEGRKIRDGEVQTACQQACPTNAIIFGNIKDPNSEISRIKSKDPRRYIQLPELDFQPALSFLKKVNHQGSKA